MNMEWLENLTKPLSSLLTPIAERVGNVLGHKAPRLYVHVVSPQAVWGIAKNENQEMMQTVCWADINHDHAKTLIITDAYPQGTHSEIRATFNFVIPPEQMVHEQIASFSSPIKGERGKNWTGRLILVDQFKRKYKTDKITFRWVRGVIPNAEKR